jgi:hypothetical protein
MGQVAVDLVIRDFALDTERVLADPNLRAAEKIMGLYLPRSTPLAADTLPLEKRREHPPQEWRKPVKVPPKPLTLLEQQTIALRDKVQAALLEHNTTGGFKL